MKTRVTSKIESVMHIFWVLKGILLFQVNNCGEYMEEGMKKITPPMTFHTLINYIYNIDMPLF